MQTSTTTSNSKCALCLQSQYPTKLYGVDAGNSSTRIQKTVTTDRSPMRMLAMTHFTETFGDLLSVRASVGGSEQQMVEYVSEQLFFYKKDIKAAWQRRVRAAFYFLDHGSLENPKGVAERFLNCGELLGMSINAAMDAKKESQDISEIAADAIIRRKLDYYKELLEGPYRVLLAPVAYAFSRVLRNTDPDFIPSLDGKAKLSVIPKIERLTIYPQSQLALGVNTHVRNAYAHANYRILDWKHVELWDPAPQKKNKPQKMWGPETWHVDKIDELTEDLELTNLALLHAITIYAINNRTQISARGWSKTLTRPKLTEKELRFSVEHMASDLCFEPKSFVINGSVVHIEFSTRHPGIDQTEKLILGGDKWARQLLQKVEYVEVPVIQQLLGLFQRTNLFWEGYSQVEVAISDPDGKALGAIALDTSVIPKLEGPSKMPINVARKLLSTDTLQDTTMSYRVEYPPVDDM